MAALAPEPFRFGKVPEHWLGDSRLALATGREHPLNMQLNPVISPQLVRPVQPLTPVAQVALSPAVQAAQQTVPTVRTQTAQAPQAAGRSDQSRDSRSETDSGNARDTRAAATNARTNARGYGLGDRGTRLDISV